MSRTGDQRHKTRNQRAPIAAPRTEAGTNRRHGIIFCSVVLVGVSAVIAVLMLTLGPTSPAPAAQSGAMSGSMPGMDHGSGGMPASSPPPTTASEMPAMDHGPDEMAGMAGMDHGAGEMPATSPTPTMAADMPGMDHGSGHSQGKTDDHGTSDMPGMDHGVPAAAVDRPLAPVLGTFGGGSAAVMLSAVFLRRRDRARSQAKQCARAARRGQK